MTPKEQLKLWVEGKSVHNEEKGECCPDFSCCNKKINTPIEVRKRFAKAVEEGDKKVEHQMLGMFLGEALATLKKKAYVAGVDEPSEIN